MGKYTFRLLEKEDLPSLAALHKEYLDVERDNNFYEWKYWDNPAGPHRCTIGVNNETGEVVGEIGSIANLFQFFGTPVRAYHEVDIVIAEGPDRGRLFLMTYGKRSEVAAQETERILNFNFAFSIPLTLKITTKLWRVQDMGPVPKLARVLRYKPVLQEKTGSPFIGAAAGLVLDGWTRIRFPSVAPRGIEVCEVDAFDDSADRFWEKIKDLYNIWTVRNAAYLNWRYSAIPHIDNRIFLARKNGEILGYLIIRTPEVGARRGHIQDFQFLSEREDAGRALLVKALGAFSEARTSAVVSWTYPHSHSYPVLKEFGFVPRETTGRNLVLRPADEIKKPYDAVSFDRVLELSNWHICKGDADDE